MKRSSCCVVQFTWNIFQTHLVSFSHFLVAPVALRHHFELFCHWRLLGTLDLMEMTSENHGHSLLPTASAEDDRKIVISLELSFLKLSQFQISQQLNAPFFKVAPTTQQQKQRKGLRRLYHFTLILSCTKSHTLVGGWRRIMGCSSFHSDSCSKIFIIPLFLPKKHTLFRYSKNKTSVILLLLFLFSPRPLNQHVFSWYGGCRAI